MAVRATILCQLENIKQIIHLDIATGDSVTPHPVTYAYKAIFNDESFSIIAYTIETILAEKLQTIYSRNFLNSRSKDFYDVYILSKLKKNDIDFRQLNVACQRTFSYRETELDYNEIVQLMESFKTDPIQQQQWQYKQQLWLSLSACRFVALRYTKKHRGFYPGWVFFKEKIVSKINIK